MKSKQSRQALFGERVTQFLSLEEFKNNAK